MNSHLGRHDRCGEGRTRTCIPGFAAPCSILGASGAPVHPLELLLPLSGAKIPGIEPGPGTRTQLSPCTNTYLLTQFMTLSASSS